MKNGVRLFKRRGMSGILCFAPLNKRECRDQGIRAGLIVSCWTSLIYMRKDKSHIQIHNCIAVGNAVFSVPCGAIQRFIPIVE